MTETYPDVSELQGLVLASAVAVDDALVLTTVDGTVYTFSHHQDCCEHVYIESIVGDLADLVGSPLLLAEAVSSESLPPKNEGQLLEQRGLPHDRRLIALGEDYVEAYEWTFYKLATVKGYVDVRWYGTSNGYYSTGVTLTKQLTQ